MTALRIPLSELQLSAIRAQGAGGQNINKVASAVRLRFDIRASSLAPDIKARLLALPDGRITPAGVLVIKAQQQRTQQANKLDALRRLQALLDSVALAPKARLPTQPSYAARLRWRVAKVQRAQLKTQRRLVLAKEL